jgi:hypothetical protein
MTGAVFRLSFKVAIYSIFLPCMQMSKNQAGLITGRGLAHNGISSFFTKLEIDHKLILRSPPFQGFLTLRLALSAFGFRRFSSRRLSPPLRSLRLPSLRFL